MKRKHLLSIVVMIVFCLVLLQQIGASGQSSVKSQPGGIRTLTLMGGVDSELWDTLDIQASWSVFEDMLAEANINLVTEAISAEQYASVLQTRLATETDVPDLVYINQLDSATRVNFGKTGLFLDVRPLVDQYSNGNIKRAQEKYFPSYWGPVVADDGKAYYMPGWNTWMVAGKPGNSLMVPLIRYDWLQKLGLPIPKTMAEFSSTLKAFRADDVNESGSADEVLIFTPTFEYFGPLFGLPKSHIAVDITDNKIKSPWLMKDKLIPYIQWLQDMVNSEVLDVEAFNKPWDYTSNKIKSNMVGCMTGFALTGFYDTMVTDFDGAYLGVVTPNDPNDFYVYGAPGAHGQGSSIAITKYCDDLEAAIDFFDVCHTEEYAILQRFGVEGVSHTVVDGLAMPVEGEGTRDFALSGKASLAGLAGGIVPTFRIEHFEQFLANLGSNPELVAMRQELANTYSSGFPKVYVWGDYQRAMLPDADARRYAELSTDLFTYMDETLTKLALGQYKVADIDIYINQMKKIGLEEAVAIQQKSHDAFIGK